MWREQPPRLQHITVVSTGGGFRDQQVRYGLTILDELVASHRGISVSTTAVPKAWVSTDHLCAVWCRQMVLITKRALFDMIDRKTSQISTDPDFRMKIFDHHFISNNGLKDYLSSDFENKDIKLTPSFEWEQKVDTFFRYTEKRTKGNKYLVIPIFVEENMDSIYIQTNISSPDWICYCDIVTGNKCETCKSLSWKSRLLPPLYSNMKYIKLHFDEFPFSKQSHILVKIPAGSKHVSVTSERYNSNERHLMYQMPNLYDTIISYPISATDGAALMKISNGSLFYSLHLSGLNLPTNTYTAKIVPQFCKRLHAEYLEGSVVKVNIPWSHEDMYAYGGFGKSFEIPIKLQTGKPPGYDGPLDATEPHLEMFLHPSCQYTLRLVVASRDILGQAVRFYGVLLPGYFVSALLLSLKGVLMSQGQTWSKDTPADCVLKFAKPHFIVPISTFLQFLVNKRPFSKLLSWLPKDDSSSLEEQGLWFTMLPLVVFTAAWLVTYLHSAFVTTTLGVLAYLGRLFQWVPEGVIRPFELFVSAMACMLTFLCGTLGLILISALLVFKVLQLLSQISQRLDSKSTHHKLAIFASLMMLVNWQLIFGLAPLLHWTQEALATKVYFASLKPDPTRLSSVCTCLSVGVLLFCRDVTLPESYRKLCGGMLYVTVVAVMMYAMESVYHIPLFISASFLIISVPTLVFYLVLKFVKTEEKTA